MKNDLQTKDLLDEPFVPSTWEESIVDSDTSNTISVIDLALMDDDSFNLIDDQPNGNGNGDGNGRHHNHNIHNHTFSNSPLKIISPNKPYNNDQPHAQHNSLNLSHSIQYTAAENGTNKEISPSCNLSKHNRSASIDSQHSDTSNKSDDSNKSTHSNVSRSSNISSHSNVSGNSNLSTHSSKSTPNARSVNENISTAKSTKSTLPSRSARKVTAPAHSKTLQRSMTSNKLSTPSNVKIPTDPPHKRKTRRSSNPPLPEKLSPPTSQMPTSRRVKGKSEKPQHYSPTPILTAPSPIITATNPSKSSYQELANRVSNLEHTILVMQTEHQKSLDNLKTQIEELKRERNR